MNYLHIGYSNKALPNIATVVKLRKLRRENCTKIKRRNRQERGIVEDCEGYGLTCDLVASSSVLRRIRQTW
jgi:hypothetical protein